MRDNLLYLCRNLCAIRQYIRHIGFYKPDLLDITQFSEDNFPGEGFSTSSHAYLLSLTNVVLNVFFLFRVRFMISSII